MYALPPTRELAARVLQVNPRDGRPSLVLEHLEGLDLRALLSSQGPQPVARAVDLVLLACEALAVAHVAGVLHRDLRPENLVLCLRPDDSPCVKLLGLGVEATGSPRYTSPEQMIAARVDERADLWSPGAILHELLAGEPPFAGETIPALCTSIARTPPPPLTRLRSDVPPGLDAVVRRCLEKVPARRYDNVAQLGRALSNFGSERGLAAAERIGRIIEGGIDVTGSCRSAPAPAVAEVARESPPRLPRRRFRGAPVVAALAFLVVSGAGWRGADTVRFTKSRAGRVSPALARPAVPEIAPIPSPTPAASAMVVPPPAFSAPQPSSSAAAMSAPSSPAASRPSPAPHHRHASHHDAPARKTADAVAHFGF